ncbi:MAG TPA: hypothetical protein VE990_06225, partial [Acidimicrobiales bacterium]|nr:hypothetical protein [Acidimicrobiales bacterium]
TPVNEVVETAFKLEDQVGIKLAPLVVNGLYPEIPGLEEAAASHPGSDDLIVLDAPAAGHAVTFLTSARGLLDAFRVGPVRAQAAEVVELLNDGRRCQVMLVTLPEETPVNEVVETAFKLEDQVGIKLAPLVVNGVYPEVPGLEEAAARPPDDPAGKVMAEAARFRLGRQGLQSEQLGRLTESLPLPQLRLPFLFTTDIGPGELSVLADRLAEAIEAMPMARA